MPTQGVGETKDPTVAGTPTPMTFGVSIGHAAQLTPHTNDAGVPNEPTHANIWDTTHCPLRVYSRKETEEPNSWYLYH